MLEQERDTGLRAHSQSALNHRLEEPTLTSEIPKTRRAASTRDEPCESLNNSILLNFSQSWEDGQTYQFFVYCFADWEVTSAETEILINWMVVHGYVMHLNVDTGASKSVKYLSTVLNSHGKQVVSVPEPEIRFWWKYHWQIRQERPVPIGDLISSLDKALQLAELRQTECCLDVSHSVVVAKFRNLVAPGPPLWLRANAVVFEPLKGCR
tara:strand:- start:143 stop:772 length:630 start_codon:yes stop_codon:yes gene_type:complete